MRARKLNVKLGNLVVLAKSAYEFVWPHTVALDTYTVALVGSGSIDKGLKSDSSILAHL